MARPTARSPTGPDRDRAATAVESADASDRKRDTALAAFLKEILQQLFVVSVLRNHNIRPSTHEPIALPRIHATTVHLIARHGNCHAAHALYFLDLDEAVAEAE